MQFQSRKRRKVLINITSLIDVLFMLLLFVLVTTTFLEQPGIKLDLPGTRDTGVAEQREYVLFVAKDGSIFLNEQALPLDDLEEKIRGTLPAMKDQTLVLNADQNVTHGTVVKIMDIVKRGGVKRLVIGTKVEKTD